jgi:hypothetical protein
MQEDINPQESEQVKGAFVAGQHVSTIQWGVFAHPKSDDRPRRPTLNSFHCHTTALQPSKPECNSPDTNHHRLPLIKILNQIDYGGKFCKAKKMEGVGAFMFSYANYAEFRLYNGKSILLLMVLSFLAYLVSPLNSMRRKEQEGLLLVYPALILVYWWIFQVCQLSLDPHVHYYLGPTKVYAWMTNSYICLTFGAAFSRAILFSPGIGRRCYGGLFLALYILLLMGATLIRPPMMTG